MATSTYAQIIQGIGHCVTEIDRIEAELRHLRGQLGELRMAARNWRDVPESGDRREQPVQGSEYETLQGFKKGIEGLRAEVDPYGNAESTGHWGCLVAGGDLRSRLAIRNFTDEVPRQVHDAGSNEPTHESGIQLEAETPSCGSDTRKDF